MSKKEVNIFVNFRRNIQVLLAANQITAPDLSEKLGWYRHRITNIAIKNGRHKPTAEELFTLAKYFKVPVDDLIHKQITVHFNP